MGCERDLGDLEGIDRELRDGGCHLEFPFQPCSLASYLSPGFSLMLKTFDERVG